MLPQASESASVVCNVADGNRMKLRRSMPYRERYYHRQFSTHHQDAALRVPRCRRPAGRWVEIEFRDPLRDIPRRAARPVSQRLVRITIVRRFWDIEECRS